VLLKQGSKMGNESVADIATDTLTFVRPDVAPATTVTTNVHLGTTIGFPERDVEKLLSMLGPPAPVSSNTNGKQPGSWEPAQKLPELSADRKLSVLEELKKKRAQSLGAAATAATPETPPQGGK
jgi:hypothetical protein